MNKPVKVWDTNSEFGDVEIARFAYEADAILFAKTKAKRVGGFNTGVMVGTSYETRVSVSVD
jgi:hypothetical protein